MEPGGEMLIQAWLFAGLLSVLGGRLAQFWKGWEYPVGPK